MPLQRYVNNSKIPLSMAVFLATDNYDHEENVMSATSFLKSTRQLILSSRVPEEMNVVDISGLAKSRLGSAVHDAIERAWLDNPHETMRKLGWPERMISRVVVNPLPGELKEDDIPVYLEQRAYKEVMGVTVSGKFDFVAEGRVEDFKTTSVHTYMRGNKTEDYRIQGSIYRWLNPDIITDDIMVIQFYFTDWSAAQAKNPKYPSNQILPKTIPLMSIQETDVFVKAKLTELKLHENSPEKDLPPCSDSDLWRSESVWKYYKNPEKTKRSNGNFDTKQEAFNRLAQENGVGIVKEVKGRVMACKYCAAYPICTQKDEYLADGSLKM